ncbi:DUF6705 family protein [Flavobacterium ardleyense]|uniref:DUF6705 family protein n=1 Tax=Flavobacterium ardleyense TaxID=2038737 RepID=A0ABW5Z6H6_9FLAO
MKNIFYTLFIGLFFSFSNAQTIVDMAGKRQNEHYENGTYYIKDINNYMLPYLGTWKYVDGNKEFRITLTKVTKHHVVYTDYNINHYIDGLRIQYQKYENGQLIYNSIVRQNPTGIIKEFRKLNMSFTDYERNNEIFPVDLLLIPLNNMGTPQYKLKFKLDKFERRNTYYEQHPNEPYFSVPDNIEMIKMN